MLEDSNSEEEDENEDDDEYEKDKEDSESENEVEEQASNDTSTKELRQIERRDESCIKPLFKVAEDSKDSSSGLDAISYLRKSMKRSLSIHNENSNCLSSDFATNSFDIREFISKIPSWGAKAFINERQTNISIVNTCPIDYPLLSIWLSSRLSARVKQQLNEFDTTIARVILEIIDLIQIKEWNKAKSLWLLDPRINGLSKNKDNIIDAEGTIYDSFTKFISELQTHKLTAKCDCKSKLRQRDVINFLQDNQRITISLDAHECGYCNRKVPAKFKFDKMPPFCTIENTFNLPISMNQLQREILIDGTIYSLLCGIFYVDTNKHFKAIFNLNSKFYLVDDLKPTFLQSRIPTHTIETAIYYPRD